MQGKINIQNYEAFLLDYMEGNLTAENIRLLKEFAASHPELQIDLEDTELAYVEDESLLLGSKDFLKKTNSDLVPDELLIGYVENILSKEEKERVIISCERNAVLAKDLELYRRTILTADATIVFENKEDLKRQTKILEFYPFVFRAAAAILLLAVLSVVFYGISGSSESGKKFATLDKTFNRQGVNAVPNENSSSNVSPHSTISSENIAVITPNTNAASKHQKENTSRKEQLLLANNTSEDNLPAKKDDQIPVLKKQDALPSVIDSAKNTLTSNSSIKKNSFVVLEETYDDQETAPKNEKKGFWVVARKALSSLNRLGVKKVNGTESVSTSSETTVLSLGNFQIQKNNYNAE